MAAYPPAPLLLLLSSLKKFPYEKSIVLHRVLPQRSLPRQPGNSGGMSCATQDQNSGQSRTWQSVWTNLTSAVNTNGAIFSWNVRKAARREQSFYEENQSE